MAKLASFRAKRQPLAETHPVQPPATETTAAIVHVDMDAFFVNVELLERPELRGRPVVVGGRPDQRGVVSAASYEARKYGIHSAMPLRTAARLCPHAVFLESRHQLYEVWGDRVAAILTKYTPVVERASIDEAYLDLGGTERLLGPALGAAHRLRGEIRERTGLPCSIGVASTRLVAKVASEQAKPGGLLWVPAGAEAAFLAPLPVRRIPGIGPVTEAALRTQNIETVGQLAEAAPEKLEREFGQWGTALYRKARGEDAYEFLVDAEPKSISHDQTFSSDTDDAATLGGTLSHLCEKAGKRLRDAGLATRTVTLTLRYASFRTISRSRTLAEPTDLDAVILAAIRELFKGAWDRAQKIRLVGVALSSLESSAAPMQLDLLDTERRERKQRLARAADRLRDRFGFSKIQLGGSLRKPEEE